MKSKLIAVAAVCACISGLALKGRWQAYAGEVPLSAYKVLAPIRHGNLTVFPVVARISHDTNAFLTLDEGLRTGEVVITESGEVNPLIRRGRWPERPVHNPLRQAQVNQLVLVNNSKRPLILLAGEIVTGGKQDRVIAKDRIVPAESDPIDLGVFCVEPGRWVASSTDFGSGKMLMAAPAVRGKAMADKNQAQVWSEVRKAQQAVVAAPLPAPDLEEVQSTSSYARVMENKSIQKHLDSIAAPIEADYSSLIRQLRNQNAVGVVVAVNGEIIWADIFGSTELLQKYWPKLIRSYAAEAMVTRTSQTSVSEKTAQEFLEDMDGRHETVESEPGLYRHTEITGDGFKAFELTSLLPKTGFDLHIAKMAE